MAASTQLVEKKVHFLGSWVNDEVTKNVIAKILNLIQSEKGSKVKLQLNRDGLRILRSQMIQGKVLQDFIPFSNIYFVTVNQNVPHVLFVVSKAMNTYQIYTFKCANGLDSGLFIQGFREIRKTFHPLNTAKLHVKTDHDGINWTLRSKNEEDKRQLSKLVDIHGGKAAVQVNGDDPQPPASPRHKYVKLHQKSQNSPTDKTTEVVSTSVTTETTTKSRTLSNGTTFSDNASEVSETALRSELESLSNELRDIKIMLEKSTGINPNDVKKHTEWDAMDAEVLPDDYDETGRRTTTVKQTTYASRPRPVQNGHADFSGAVKVSVPDYRNTLIHDKPRVIDSTDSSGYSSASTGTGEQFKGSTTTYENWRNRVEWRTRAHPAPRSRAVVIDTSRWSHDKPEILRAKRQTIAYRRTYDPRLVRAHPQAKSASLRVRTATTVEKPIESVYRKHGHSVVLRPTSGHNRPTILTAAPDEQEKKEHVIEPNNNDLEIQTELFEKAPNAHVEVATSRSAIIRT